MTKYIYKFYVDRKLKASCGENRKEEVFNELEAKYGIGKVDMYAEDFEIDEIMQSLINEIKKIGGGDYERY